MTDELEKKYLVLGGYVNSKNDGQRHYIGCNKLMKLYGVSPNECYCREEWDIYGGYPEGLKILRPNYEGYYSL